MVVNYNAADIVVNLLDELHGAEKNFIYLPAKIIHYPLFTRCAFGPKDLDIAAHLLAEENHDLVADHQDDLLIACFSKSISLSLFK